jgi:hypothetical protein
VRSHVMIRRYTGGQEAGRGEIPSEPSCFLGRVEATWEALRRFRAWRRGWISMAPVSGVWDLFLWEDRCCP